MAADALLALSVALNTWAIGHWMCPVLLRLAASLRRELERSRRYLRIRPTRLRERSLQRRSLRAAGQVTAILLALLLVVLLFAPSVIFAGTRGDTLASLLSIEAGIGMLAGSLAWYRWRRRS